LYQEFVCQIVTYSIGLKIFCPFFSNKMKIKSTTLPEQLYNIKRSRANRARTLVLYVSFVDHCFFCCTLSFDFCVFCSSSIYDSDYLFWHLQAVVGGVAVACIICSSVLCFIVHLTIRRIRQNKGQFNVNRPTTPEEYNGLWLSIITEMD
jgi:hypothetical protein